METDSERPMLLSKRVRPAAEVLVSVLGDEIVMLDLASERYFGLDPVGAAFWEALTTAPHAGAAVDALLEVYEVDRETLTRDVSSMIAQLMEKGLLEASDAAPG